VGYESFSWAISNLNKKIHEGILRNGEIFLSKITIVMCILMEAGCGLKKVSVLVATVESMERVSGRFPAFLKGRVKEVATMLKAIHAKGKHGRGGAK